MVTIKYAFVAALIFTLTSCQEVTVDDNNCPVGPGVNRKTIKIGTEATCRCVVTRQGDSSAQAVWFRQDNTTVGAVNGTDGSSVLTFSYNPSETNQTFECRPNTTLPNAGKGVTYSPQFRRDYLIRPKYSLGSFIYPLPQNVTSITWQAGNNTGYTVDIATCQTADGNCTNFLPSFYNVAISKSDNMTALWGIQIRYNETQFSFVTNNGVRSAITEVEFYAAPFLLECRQNLTLSYVDFTCSTSNIYPSAVAQLHKEEKDFEPGDMDFNHTGCVNGVFGNGSLGDYRATCTWRIQMRSLLPMQDVTVIMYPDVSNTSGLEHEHENQSDLIVINLPVVYLDPDQCPGRFGRVIKKDINATCRCYISSPIYQPGQARWYSQNGTVVGAENQTDWSSTLTISYNPADPNPKFTCKPYTELPGNVNEVYYNPKYSSSTPQILLTGLQPMIVLLGVILSGVVSR